MSTKSTLGRKASDSVFNRSQFLFLKNATNALEWANDLIWKNDGFICEAGKMIEYLDFCCLSEVFKSMPSVKLFGLSYFHSWVCICLLVHGAIRCNTG